MEHFGMIRLLQGYVTADVADEEGLTKNVLSGTKFRKALRAGEEIPDWCAFAPPQALAL